jgi:hypothetical protein
MRCWGGWLTMMPCTICACGGELAVKGVVEVEEEFFEEEELVV